MGIFREYETHPFFIVGGSSLKRVTSHLLAKMVRWCNTASMLELGGSNVLQSLAIR